MKLYYSNFFCLALSTLFSFSAYAENHLLLMGGGGEPVGVSTIFDGGLKKFAPNLNKSNWNYDISFNGGHSKTEEMLRTEFKNAKSKSDFTPKQYKDLIDSYKAKILLGDIKKGDQLMIIIDTHGAMNSGKEETHLIAAKGKVASDLNKLSDADLVSLDTLKELVQLTNDRGISLGIVDLSCHSGSTLKLKSPNTCVVTATGPSHYGFAGAKSFSDLFLANLVPGKTMEQAFLKARAETQDASYPMISTQEHESIASEVYSSITPYLYFYDPKADKISDYFLKASSDQVTCQREAQFDSLIKKIENLNRLVPPERANQLTNLIQKYKTDQDKILTQIKTLGGQYIEKIETFNTAVEGSKKPINWNFSWKEIMDIDADAMIANFSSQAKRAKNKADKNDALAVAENYRKVKAKKNEIITKYPKIKEYEIESKEFIKTLGKNIKDAEKIAFEERKFYDELYRSKQGLNFNDPCRKIVF